MDGEPTQREDQDAARRVMGIAPISGPVVVRRSGQGWQVGAEETADLTSAMVLADLLAADLGSPAPPPAGPTKRPARLPGSR